jgi:hypothetical protein
MKTIAKFAFVAMLLFWALHPAPVLATSLQCGNPQAVACYNACEGVLGQCLNVCYWECFGYEEYCLPPCDNQCGNAMNSCVAQCNAEYCN